MIGKIYQLKIEVVLPSSGGLQSSHSFYWKVQAEIRSTSANLFGFVIREVSLGLVVSAASVVTWPLRVCGLSDFEIPA